MKNAIFTFQHGRLAVFAVVHIRQWFESFATTQIFHSVCFNNGGHFG